MNVERLLAKSDWLRSLARRLVRDAHTADDLVQDTLVAALQRGPVEASYAGLRAWLATVARNFARRRHRDAAVRQRHEALAVLEPDDANAAAPELERMRLQRRLVEAVLALNEPIARPSSCAISADSPTPLWPNSKASAWMRPASAFRAVWASCAGASSAIPNTRTLRTMIGIPVGSRSLVSPS